MKRKIRVAFFSDILVKNFDGATRTMYHLIERIPDSEFEFLFVCGMGPTHDFRYPVIKVPTIAIPFNPTYRMAFPLLEKKKIYKILDDFSPDVIHIASPSFLGSLGADYKEAKGISALTIYHTHFISYIEYYLRRVPFLVSPSKKIVVWSQKKLYSRMDLIYIPTQAIIDDLLQYGYETERMKIWARGVDHSVFSPENRDNDFIQSITKNTKPNVLFVSRLVWEKNLATLIRIYKLSKAKGNKYNFIIAGDGIAKEKISQKMKDSFILGKVDHTTLAKLYASSDVFIFPSISETYGNVVVEAMASGCPCIIGRGGGSQSLVEDGVRGFLCSPNDAEEYLEKIDLLIENEGLRQSMINNGLEYTSHLEWEVLVSQYFDDLKKLTSSKNNYFLSSKNNP